MPTGSKKVRAKAKAFKVKQAKLYKSSQRKIKIQYLKKDQDE